MTLEEAIKHCEEVAENNEKIAGTFEYSLKTKSDCKKCASEHRQLAEWLRELQALRRSLNNGDLRGCENCKYNYVDIIDYPCSECERTDLWEVDADDNS